MQKINSGDRFGRLTVIKETTVEERVNKGGRNYLCQCDCGNQKIIYGHNLKTGNTKSCGCLSREVASINNSADIKSGDKFGKLTVIMRAPKRPNHQAYWLCQCECGNIKELSTNNLRSDGIKSCGCLKQKDTINEIGNIYGELMVISRAGSRIGGGALWECECSCGNKIIVRGESLRSGHTKSCGCIKSWKEKEINELLNKYNIQYINQYCFSDLKTKSGVYLRFDFAIFNNDQLIYLIEYQGEQHTDINNQWYSQEYEYRDKLKQEYCKNNNITLIFWNKYTNIEEEIIKIFKADREGD